MYYLLYALALLTLSQSGVIIRWSETNALILGAWRLLFAGMILYFWSRWRRSHEKVNKQDQRKIIAAGFAFFIHLFSYAYAAHTTSIAHLMLIYSLNPVTTAMGSWLFFKEKLTRRQGTAYVLALIGIYLLAREKQGTSQILGDMLAIVAAVAFSAYALISQWARRGLSNSVFASRMYFAGSAFFFLTAFLSGTPLVADSSKGWMGIALLTVFPTLLGHGIFTLTMKHIPMIILSIGKLIEPVFSAFSAYLLFGENISSSALISFAIIIGAVVLVVKPQRSRPHQHPKP